MLFFHKQMSSAAISQSSTSFVWFLFFLEEESSETFFKVEGGDVDSERDDLHGDEVLAGPMLMLYSSISFSVPCAVAEGGGGH